MNDIPAIRTDKRLKPCPYCGNEKPTINQMDLHLFEVGCSIYKCDMPCCIIAFDEKSAIAAWNHMVDDVINKRSEES